MNLKRNKIKIIAGVVFLLVLISSILSFVGCVRSEPQVEKGQYYYETYTDREMCFKIVSDKCTFDVDDMTIKLYIGLHKKEYPLSDWSSIDREILLRKTQDYSQSPYNDGTFYYVIFAINNTAVQQNGLGDKILDYSYILKEITAEESLKNGEYNFTKEPYSSDYFYNHYEYITIPKECLLEGAKYDGSWIGIGICLVKKNEITGKYEYPTDYIYHGWSYHIIEEDQISISHWNIK